ncbi:MAG: PfkB family carbohydrate kinase [Oscillospiraceae bacterium]|nr:PfkB family carbohydrate kinase [Oscillospiraceae bacterium]
MKTRRLPRVLSVHALPVFGRCSISVVAPVLSARGVQCCSLPTALLSTPTNYAGATILSLSSEAPAVLSHLRSLEMGFDAIYSGFLADGAQADFIEEIYAAYPDALRVVDPVLGDRGRLYRTMDGTMAAAVRRLSQKAHIITPNVTEAAVLLELPPDKTPYTEEDAKKWLNELSRKGASSVVITGLSFDRRSEIFVGWARQGASGLFRHAKTGGDYPGAGDLFTSFMLAELLHGAPLSAAAKDASGFVASCAAFTAGRGTDVKEGLLFEDILRNKPNR